MANSTSNLTLPIRGSTKFGDSDVASKRRKSHHTNPDTSEPVDDDDEYNTLFTKRLTDGSNLNSTACCQDETDFTGGFVSPLKSSTPKEEVHDPWQPHDLLSPTPSASSRGFENTFKVLESQMRTTSKLTPAQVNQVLLGANLQANPIFLNVPFGARDRFLRAISEERGSNAGDDDVDEESNAPSFLELELDARQRIREIELEESKPKTLSDNDQTLVNLPAAECEPSQCSSMTEFLYGIPIHGDKPSERIRGSILKEEEIAEDEGDYPEYVYHMARGKDKRVYLRVVRSLLVDKGNGASIYVFIFY